MTAIEGEEDHDATWLLGHTERIDFGPLFERDGELWCRARIHIPCRFLAGGDVAGTSRCTIYGYQGRIPSGKRVPASRRAGRDRFDVVERKKLVRRHLPPPAPPRRALPIAATPAANPCAAARCRTSDHKIGAACCRDVQVDICCRRDQTALEALIRSRRPPYLCKVERENDEQVVVEIISACSFLRPDSGCDLHGRTRVDGRPAKPLMCSRWPEKRSGLHSGCAFRNTRLKV